VRDDVEEIIRLSHDLKVQPLGLLALLRLVVQRAIRVIRDVVD